MSDQLQELQSSEAEVKAAVFAIGDKNEAFSQYFIGQSYLKKLVNDSTLDVGVSNVTFEPGCRNSWHRHDGGYQILLATAGHGWYQEWGQPARRLEPGDVVVVHDGTKHWHGAARNSWFSHLPITSGTPQWLEPVTDEQYRSLED